jgi:hypothetical protein
VSEHGKSFMIMGEVQASGDFDDELNLDRSI